MINTTQTVRPYAWFGSPPATFNIPFAYQNTSEIYATLSGAGLPNIGLVQGVDYSVSPKSPTGGTMTRIGTWAAYSAYQYIIVFRSTQKINAESVVNGGGIDANRLQYVIDELTQMIQENTADGSAPITGNVLRFPISDPAGLEYTVPDVALRAGKGLVFDLSGGVAAGSLSSAPINAAWQAGLAQGQVIALQVALGILPIGANVTKVQWDCEHRHDLGDYVWAADYRAPSPYDAANPESQWAGLFLGSGVDQTITDDHWPLGVSYLRNIPIAYQRGQGTEVASFSATGWSITTNVVTITLANADPENALLIAFGEEMLARGNTFAGWRTITVPALGSSVAAGDYAITGFSLPLRRITFAYTTANATGGSAAVRFYAHRVAGSTTSAVVYEASGRTLVNTGDYDEESPYGQLNEVIIGLRKRSRGQGHRHKFYAQPINNVAGSGGTLSTTSAGTTLYTYRAVDDPVTDGVNGTPRVGRTTDPRSLGAALFIWLSRFVP